MFKSAGSSVASGATVDEDRWLVDLNFTRSTLKGVMQRMGRDAVKQGHTAIVA